MKLEKFIKFFHQDESSEEKFDISEIVPQLEELYTTLSSLSNLAGLAVEAIRLKQEVDITREIETTKRQYIEYLKEKSSKELEILQSFINDVVRAKIKNVNQIVEKELDLIDIAIKKEDLELLKLGLGALIKTISNPVLMEEDINAINKALRGDSDIDIEI